MDSSHANTCYTSNGHCMLTLIAGGVDVSSPGSLFRNQAALLKYERASIHRRRHVEKQQSGARSHWHIATLWAMATAAPLELQRSLLPPRRLLSMSTICWIMGLLHELLPPLPEMLSLPGLLPFPAFALLAFPALLASATNTSG
jgi:hypothetical protein